MGLALYLSIPCICVREVWRRENAFRVLSGAVELWAYNYSIFLVCDIEP